MHPTILNAYKKAVANLDNLLQPPDTTEIRTALEKKSKKELIEMLIQHFTPNQQKPTLETMAYAILEDPDCAWLTFDVVAELIKSKVPEAKTTKSCLSWYQSNAIAKGRNVVPRKSKAEILALVMQSQQ